MIEDFREYTKTDYEAELVADGFPRTGFINGVIAPDDKQKTVRPYPVEEISGKIYEKADRSKKMGTGKRVTKAFVQGKGVFKEPVKIVAPKNKQVVK